MKVFFQNKQVQINSKSQISLDNFIKLISINDQNFATQCGIPNLGQNSSKSKAELVNDYVKFLKWFCFIYLMIIIIILLLITPKSDKQSSNDSPDTLNNVKDVVLVE